MTETRQLRLPFVHAPRLGEEDFLAAPSNAEALAWLDRTADWPQGRLALWGPAGSGKTHLLHVWAGRAGAALLSGPGLRFVPPDRPLAIDDADAAAERPLLHMLNAAAEAGQPVLLAGRQAPARWGTALPDLGSRLRAVTAVAIGAAEEDLLRRLLARLLAERQVGVPEPVQDWLRLRLPRSAAAMREVAARLDLISLGSRDIRAAARKALADMQVWEEDAQRNDPLNHSLGNDAQESKDSGDSENEDFAHPPRHLSQTPPLLL